MFFDFSHTPRQLFSRRLLTHVDSCWHQNFQACGSYSCLKSHALTLRAYLLRMVISWLTPFWLILVVSRLLAAVGQGHPWGHVWDFWCSQSPQTETRHGDSHLGPDCRGRSLALKQFFFHYVSWLIHHETWGPHLADPAISAGSRPTAYQVMGKG